MNNHIRNKNMAPTENTPTRLVQYIEHTLLSIVGVQSTDALLCHFNLHHSLSHHCVLQLANRRTAILRHCVSRTKFRLVLLLTTILAASQSSTNYTLNGYVLRKPWIRLPCANCVHCLAQIVDPRFTQTIHGLSAQIVIHAWRNTESQVPHTKPTGRNRREGLPLATQGKVRGSYLGLGILHCSFGGFTVRV